MSYLWVFVAAGVGTLLIRLSGVVLMGGERDIPEPVTRALRLIAPAALAAILANSLLLEAGEVRPLGRWHLAAVVAVGVALWLRSMGWTLVIGGAFFAVTLVVLGGCSASLDPGPSVSPSLSPTSSPSSSPSPSPSATLLYDPLPPPGTPWQIQLDGGVPDDPGTRIVEVDYQASEDLVGRLERTGVYTICYMSAGTVEEYRPDADAFPNEIVGRALPDWPDERYLDLRRLDTLAPLWEARLDACAEAGFDAVDPDNIDSYENDSGFPLTEDDAVAAMLWLADAAHERGMAIGQKNASGLTERLVGVFDFAVTEECLTQGWCEEMTPYVDAGKPVLAIEYVEDGATLDRWCGEAKVFGLSLLVTSLDLPGDGTGCAAK